MPSALVTPDGEKLRRLRMRLGWTQEDAAHFCGYSDRLIRKAERGHRVRVSTLKTMVECYQSYLDCAEAPPWITFIESPVRPESEGADQEAIHRKNGLKHGSDDAEDCDLAAGDSLKDRLRDYFQAVYIDRRLDAIDQFVSPTVRLTTDGVTRVGIEEVKQRAKMLLNGFNPIQITYEGLHAEGNTVIIHFVARMIHVGEFLGIPTTGLEVTVRSCSIVQFENRYCTEVHDQTDVAHLLAQLHGVVPPLI